MPALPVPVLRGLLPTGTTGSEALCDTTDGPTEKWESGKLDGVVSLRPPGPQSAAVSAARRRRRRRALPSRRPWPAAHESTNTVSRPPPLRPPATHKQNYNRTVTRKYSTCIAPRLSPPRRPHQHHPLASSPNPPNPPPSLAKRPTPPAVFAACAAQTTTRTRRTQRQESPAPTTRWICTNCVGQPRRSLHPNAQATCRAGRACLAPSRSAAG